MAYEDIFNFDDIGYDPSIGIDTLGTSELGQGGGGIGMGELGMGLSVAGTLGKAYGTLQMGKQIKAADEYNAALVREAGAMEMYQLDKSEVSLASTQRAMYAKAGVTQSGSPLDTMLESAAGFELDKQISKYNTESRANMLDYEGKMALKKAKQDSTMQLLEGAASFALMLA